MLLTRDHNYRRLNTCAALGILLAVCLASPLAAQKYEKPPQSPQAWTGKEAIEQWQLSPDDPYLQYIAFQLNRGNEDGALKNLVDQRDPRRTRRDADLFNLFSGALAVQESLQLDSMRGPNALARAASDTGAKWVNVADLKGPGVKSHPWEKMLAEQAKNGKKPEVSALSLCVPDDQYYLEFRSLGKLLEIADTGDLWGTHIFSQAATSAQSQGANERLKAQLAIKTDPLTRPFYDLVVREVALTGSDVYFREGTDVTILFELRQPALFRARMDSYLDAALKSRSDAVRTTGKIGDVEYVEVATPDRAISAFSAYPRPDLHVRSNSRAALARVLGAIQGKEGVRRLGDTAEFKYIRTLMVRGDKQEDGLLYLSDPFIHRLVGPELKITELRRMLCYNHLRMIGHASMLYRTQFGKQAKSLEDLVSTGCAPASFDAKQSPEAKREVFRCPCGGSYALSENGSAGVCTYHGHSQQLVPCIEIPQTRASSEEAEQYRRFVAEYNQYWRRFFDPIVVRFKVDEKQYRAETIILPLIDNTVYSSLSQALGGEPEPLDALPVPKRTIFSAVVRLNKEKMLQEAAASGKDFVRELVDHNDVPLPSEAATRDFLTKGIGNQVGLHIYDTTPMVDFNFTGLLGEMAGSFQRRGGGGISDEVPLIAFMLSSLTAPVYLSIPVNDEQAVDKFLDELDKSLTVAARQRPRGWLPVRSDSYKFEVKEGGHKIRCFSISLDNLVKWRIFYGRIDKGLYIASKPFILEDLAAMKPADKTDGGPKAHAMVRLRPEHWKEVLRDYQLGWAENNRQACQNNLAPLSSVVRALSADGSRPTFADVHNHTQQLYGVSFYCPDIGRYDMTADGKHLGCSVHGALDAPRQLAAPAHNSPTDQVMRGLGLITAELTFLEDGLHAVVTIDRKGAAQATANRH